MPKLDGSPRPPRNLDGCSLNGSLLSLAVPNYRHGLGAWHLWSLKRVNNSGPVSRDLSLCQPWQALIAADNSQENRISAALVESVSKSRITVFGCVDLNYFGLDTSLRI
eukprot:4989178-Amphidinium_carterae.2